MCIYIRNSLDWEIPSDLNYISDFSKLPNLNMVYNPLSFISIVKQKVKIIIIIIIIVIIIFSKMMKTGCVWKHSVKKRIKPTARKLGHHHELFGFCCPQILISKRTET